MVLNTIHTATYASGCVPHYDLGSLQNSHVTGSTSHHTSFRIDKTFSAREIHFVYCGPVTAAGIKTLTEHVAIGFHVYQPNQITVHMNSPGGLMQALEYWVYKLTEWKSQGLSIATQADTECASAAAMVVALGALGKRSAHPLSRLLFHNPRLVSRDSTLLEQDAEEAARMLKESRARMHAMLTQHLVDGLGRIGFARALYARATWLQQKLQNNAHPFQSHAWRTVSSETTCPSLAKWATSRPESSEEADNLISQWAEQLEILFRKDQCFDLPIAWALLLIDESAELPPIMNDTVSPQPDEDWSEPPRPLHTNKTVQHGMA